jgi:hypothetical protein
MMTRQAWISSADVAGVLGLRAGRKTSNVLEVHREGSRFFSRGRNHGLCCWRRVCDGKHAVVVFVQGLYRRGVIQVSGLAGRRNTPVPEQGSAGSRCSIRIAAMSSADKVRERGRLALACGVYQRCCLATWVGWTGRGRWKSRLHSRTAAWGTPWMGPARKHWVRSTHLSGARHPRCWQCCWWLHCGGSPSCSGGRPGTAASSSQTSCCRAGSAAALAAAATIARRRTATAQTATAAGGQAFQTCCDGRVR